MKESTDHRKREAFAALFPCFRKMIDSCPNSNPVHPLFYAKGLPIRIFRQTCSVCEILGRVNIPFSKNETNGDPDSIQIIARSILESYLIFHHLFIAPKSESEKEFWWFTWVLKSLVSRIDKMHVDSESLPVNSYDEKTGTTSIKSGREVKENMQKNVEEIRDVLLKNEFYKINICLPDKETQKRFKNYIEKGWKTSPTQLLREANMQHFIDWNIYGFFSDAAHTDHISVKQMLLTKSNDEQIAYSEASLGIILIAIARICLELSIPYANVKPIIVADRKALLWAATYKIVSESTSSNYIASPNGRKMIEQIIEEFS